MTSAPVWPQLEPRPNRPPPRRLDVLVIGGGISGVAALHWCRRRGLDAALLERERLAAGASGRNAGFLLCGVAENYALAAARYGRRVAADVWNFTGENHALSRELIGDRDVGYARRGSWTIAASPEEAESLRASAELLAEDRLPGHWTDELPAPLSGTYGGLLNADDGEVDPVRLVAAIAAPHRARIHEGVAVTRVETGGPAVRVVHTAGEVDAGRVILATNAYTAELFAEVPIAPVRAQMLATGPETDVRLGCPAYAGWGYRYWRQLDDGRVLMGGCRDQALEEEIGTVAEPTVRIQAALDRELTGLGVRAQVHHRWAGIMGFSPDGLPLVGSLGGHPGVSLLAGYTGHGMGFAVHAARSLVDALVDEAPLPPWLDARRLGREATRAAPPDPGRPRSRR